MYNMDKIQYNEKIFNTLIQKNPNSFIDKKKQKQYQMEIVKYFQVNYQKKDINIIMKLEKKYILIGVLKKINYIYNPKKLWSYSVIILMYTW